MSNFCNANTKKDELVKQLKKFENLLETKKSYQYDFESREYQQYLLSIMSLGYQDNKTSKINFQEILKENVPSEQIMNQCFNRFQKLKEFSLINSLVSTYIFKIQQTNLDFYRLLNKGMIDQISETDQESTVACGDGNRSPNYKSKRRRSFKELSKRFECPFVNCTR